MTVTFGFGMGTLGLAAAWLAAAVPSVVPHEPAEKNVRVVRAGTIGAGAYLGVQIEDVDAEQAEKLRLPGERGALVGRVRSDSPAQRAGLEEGDVILELQGETIRSASQLARLVRETPAGREVSILISRDGALKTLSANLERPSDSSVHHYRHSPHLPPAPPGPPAPPEAPEPPELFHFDDDDHHFNLRFDDGFLHDLRENVRGFHLIGGQRKLGISYQEISGQLAEYFGVAEGRGVLVSEVEDGGAASKAGLKAGDIIVQLGDEAIEGGRDLRRAVARAEPGQTVTVTVMRNGKKLELALEVGGTKSRSRRKAGRGV